MSGKDFYDDDLIHRRDSIKEVKFGPANEPVPAGDIPGSDPAAIKELDLIPLAKRKEEINSQVASKLDELERLRTRQESLDHDKKLLEQLRTDQEKYESGKREMIDHLEQSLISLEREIISVNQRAELLAENEKQFRERVVELRRFNEEEWPADSHEFREELVKALAVIENTRKEYNTALARIEANRDKESAVGVKAVGYSETGVDFLEKHGFLDWLKLGLAMSLPLIIVLLIFMVVLWFLFPIY